MLELRMNPKSHRVYMCSGSLTDRIDVRGTPIDMTGVMAYNGTPILMRKATVNNWPIVGKTLCLYNWQAGEYTALPGHKLIVAKAGHPNTFVFSS